MAGQMHLDHDRCSAVVRSKDPRYDGWFVTGVLSTRIYCRPSCPAITPRVRNTRFYPSAAAAQAAGFRACRRCLPDATPGSPHWQVRGDLAARAVRLIADGVVDREGVGGLAHRLGYSTRQLERLLRAELGAGPLALARAQRAQTARLLVEGTTLTMAEAALAAGFSSIRSFNDTVRGVYAATPTELRTAARRRGQGPDHAGTPRSGDGAPVTIALRLPYRAPLHAASLFGHLAATAAPGVECWGEGALSRTLRLPGGPGVVVLRPPADHDRHVAATVRLADVADLSTAIGRCRRLLDLDADPEAVDEHLGLEPALAPLVRSTPGVRLPGSVDGAELALRAVLGQQVSTAAAATQTGRLVRVLGTPLPESFTTSSEDTARATHLFPEPHLVAEAAEEQLPGMPASRRRTLRILAAALAEGAVDLGPGSDRRAAEEQLLALPGIGPWTAQIVLLRGLGDPDAFPAADLGVRTAAAAAGLPDDPRALRLAAEAWRPWRSYATALLWAATDHAAANLPGDRSPTGRIALRPAAPTHQPRPHTPYPPHRTRPGDAMTTQHLRTDSPVGTLRLTTDGEHLTGVYFSEHRHAPSDLGEEVDEAEAPPVLQEAARQLEEYFAGTRTDFELPLSADGTDFQQRVWGALGRIPYATTWSYRQLAGEVGSPGAARAVGMANGRNPISIVVPCHRVVGAGGAITGYGGGVERKQVLLDLERRVAGETLW